MRKQIVAMLTAAMLLASLLSGCGAKNTTTPPTAGSDTGITAEVEPTEEVSAEEKTEAEEQPTETVEATEVTEEPAEEVTTEEMEAPTPTETEEPAPQYTYTDMSATMYVKQSVNVRDLPDTSGKKLGGLSASQEVTVTGQCNETSWYRIDYNGSVGYVSNKYIVAEKPAEQVVQQPVSQPEQQPTNYEDCPYTLFEATFDGTYFYFYHDQTEAGYFAGCTSASNILTDLVLNTDFAKDYPRGWFGLDHEKAEATVVGTYKNTSPNVYWSDYMNVVYIKIPFKVDPI